MTHNITHVEAHWPAADRQAVSITHTYPPRPLGWEDLKTIRFRWPLALAALVPVAGWLFLTFGPGGVL